MHNAYTGASHCTFLVLICMHSFFIVAVLKGHVTLHDDPDKLQAETQDCLKNLLQTAADLGGNHQTKSSAGT